MINFIEQFELDFYLEDGKLGSLINIGASTKKLFGIDEAETPVVEDAFPRDFLSVIRESVPFLTGQNSLVMIYELSDSLWRLTIHVEEATLSVVGMRSWELRHLQNLNSIDSSITFPRSELTGTILLQRCGSDGLSIEAISPVLSGSFGVGEGDPLQMLLERTAFMHSPLIYDQVMANNLVANFFTIVGVRGERRYYNFELLPVYHSVPKLVISVYEISQAAFFKYQTTYNHAVDDFNVPADSVGIAKIRLLRKNSLTVLAANYMFSQMISMDDLSEIADSDVFDDVYENRHEAHNRFYFKNCPYPLLVSIVPLDTNELAYIFVAYERDCNNNAPFNINALLSRREREVFDLLITGKIYKEIAFSLGIAEGTVKKIASNIYKKVGVDNKFDLIKLVTGGDAAIV